MKTTILAFVVSTVIAVVVIPSLLLAGIVAIGMLGMAVDPAYQEQRDKVARAAASAQDRLERYRAGIEGTGRAMPSDWHCVSTVECERATPRP